MPATAATQPCSSATSPGPRRASSGAATLRRVSSRLSWERHRLASAGFTAVPIAGAGFDLARTHRTRRITEVGVDALGAGPLPRPGHEDAGIGRWTSVPDRTAQTPSSTATSRVRPAAA